MPRQAVDEAENSGKEKMNRPANKDRPKYVRRHLSASPRATPLHAKEPIVAGKGNPPYAVYLICNGLLLLGAVLPWEKVGAFSASGLDLNRGWVVFAVALGAGAGAAWSLLQGRPAWGLRFGQFASALAAVNMFTIEIGILANYCSEQDFICLRPDLGMGAMLTLVAGLALGGVAVFGHSRQASADPA